MIDRFYLFTFGDCEFWTDKQDNVIKIGSNQLDKVITFFVLNMAYSWNNRVDFVVRYMYGKWFCHLYLIYIIYSAVHSIEILISMFLKRTIEHGNWLFGIGWLNVLWHRYCMASSRIILVLVTISILKVFIHENRYYQQRDYSTRHNTSSYKLAKNNWSNS